MGLGSWLKGRRGVLVGLFLLGLGLRLVPVLWGSVHLDGEQYSFHPDEPKLVRYVDGFPESVGANRDYRYPLGVHHGLAPVWWVGRKVMGVGRDVPSVPGVGSYEAALVFCRVVMVVVCWGVWFWVLVVLTRAWGREGDVPWVLAFASVQTAVVAHTAVVQTDVPAAVVVGVFFVVLLRLRERGAGALRGAVVLGGLIGVATAVRYTSAVVAVPAAVHFLASWRAGRWGFGTAVGAVLGCAVLSVGVFLALVPGALYDMENFVASLRYEAIAKVKRGGLEAGVIWEELGLAAPLAHLALAGVGAWAVLRTARGRRALWYGGTLVLYLAAIHRKLRFDYLFVLLPFVGILAGIGCARIVGALGERGEGRARAVRLGGAAVFVVLWALVLRATLGRYVDDTRYRFGDWIAGQDGGARYAIAHPPRGATTYDPKLPAAVVDVGIHGEPDWIVVPEKTFRPLVNVHRDPDAYAVNGFPFDTEALTLARYGPRDIRFLRSLLAVDPDLGDEFRPFTEERAPYTLDTVIEPRGWPLDMHGLEIRIYRRADGAD